MFGRRSNACLALLVACAPATTAIAPGLRAPITVAPVRSWTSPVASTPTELQAVASPGLWQSAASWRGVAHQYRQASETHYLPMAAAQGGLLRGMADVVGQGMTHPGFYDPAQTAALAGLGLLISGYGGAVWLRHLETKLGSGTAPADVLRKTFTDYTCWAPCANSAYLLLVPLLTGHGLEESLASLQAGFASVMLLEASLFMPYNLLAFNSIPAVCTHPPARNSRRVLIPPTPRASRLAPRTSRLTPRVCSVTAAAPPTRRCAAIRVVHYRIRRHFQQQHLLRRRHPRPT